MALNDVIFIKGQGGLGRTAGDTDYVSGLLIYDVKFLDNASFTTNGITTFTSTNRIISFNRIADVEATGLTETNTLVKEYWYQIKEYFRANSTGKLFVGLYNDTTKNLVPSSLTFDEIYTMQVFAEGEIRQIGVYNTKNTYSTGDVELIQSVAAECETDHMPLSCVYGANFNTSAFADLTTLDSLRTLSTPSPKVSVVLLQDGANVGKSLFTSEGNSIPAIGALLGAISASLVNESIAWVQKFNVAFGGELETIAFVNGDLYTSLTKTELNDINSLGYIFGVKHIGIAGTYFNDNYTAGTILSDYAYISEVRTIDKAIRKVRTALLPQLNRPIKVKSNGTIEGTTIAFLRNVAVKPVDLMIGAGELSAGDVFIDPNQNILINSKLEVTIQLIPYGTARTIEVTIGFTTNL
jgi:hypothetical protein